MDDLPNLQDLRKSYERAELEEDAAALDPMRQFESWMSEAISAKVPEPNAMTLATVGPQGRPSTRIVLIKGFDARGLVWFTNYDSRKGHELEAQPFAALQFHWVELERVVRIEGASSASTRPSRTPISHLGRSIRASEPGRRRRAR